MEMSVYLHALEALFSGKSLQFPVTSKLIGPVRQPGCFVEAINHVPLPGFEPCNSQTIGNKMKCMVVCLCNQCFGSFSKCLSVVNNTPQYLSRQIEWLVTNRLMRNWDLRSLTTGLDMEDLVIIMYFFFYSTLDICKKLFTSHTVKCNLCPNIFLVKPFFSTKCRNCSGDTSFKLYCTVCIPFIDSADTLFSAFIHLFCIRKLTRYSHHVHT